VNRSRHRSDIMAMADDTTIAMAGFLGCLEHVRVPHGGVRTGSLRKDQEALVMALLIAPTTAGFIPAIPDLGTLVFEYNDRPWFNAPVSALMNRYHGLTTLAGLKNRLRLLADPLAGFGDLEEDVLLSVLPEPIHLREFLRYTFRHVPPKGAPAPDDLMLVASDALRDKGLTVDAAAVARLVAPAALTVEVQLLYKPAYVDRRELGLTWDK